MELRKRRGLMIALIAVNIGLPAIFLAVRLISHAVDPKSYGPAGGYDIFTTLVAGVMYVFGFIVAATVGCTAGSVDLTEGMFRHLVITGRSRLALYLARIPAGLAIVIPMVAIGFTIVCAVCVLAAPTQLNYDGVNVPPGLSRPRPRQLGRRPCRRGHLQLQLQRADPTANVPCGNGQTSGPPPGATIKTPHGVITVPASYGGADPGVRRHHGQSELRRLPRQLPGPIDLADGRRRPVDRPRGDHRVHRRTRTGLLDGAADGPGDPARPAGVDPGADLQPPRDHAPVNLERAVAGVAMAHIEPGGLPTPFGGGGGPGGGLGRIC